MSNWFRFVSEPMAQALVFLAHSLGDNAGLAIVVFTIGIKFLLLPLTLKQLQSAKAMQEIQPLIQELQRKHKGDKQRLTEETMALYKEKGVNPMAGCLPLIPQLVILSGLYGALLDLGNQNDLLYNPLFTAPFLWLPNLALPDLWHILPVLCVATQWIQQRMMMTTRQTDQQQQMMQNMMQFMPLMVGVFAWGTPAGLPLYWAVSTIFGIVQQYFITGWGQLFERPTFGGLSGLLGPSPDGASRDGRQPAKAKTPRPKSKAKARRG
ncbi:MAG TPA: YidC/Oxa1 family membrane protein insertase [Chloroflexota bacterium]|jgi:YidC/Oxa1 family membrane protein insertase|nr:YidC/Oxa1 family membrane protein insertase [Chloroflexota bacterium]